MTNSNKALLDVARFLVAENRNSHLASAERQELQSKKRYGKVLGILYPLGVSGGLIYCFFALWKRETLTLFRGILLEDHASNVIKNALKRTWGPGYEKELVTVSSSIQGGLSDFFTQVPALRATYKVLGVSHVTEFVRVFRLFHFYLMWKSWFAKQVPPAVLLARTNDQKRLALGAVAEEYGVPVTAFTVERVALRKPAPFAIKSMLCWSARQVNQARESGIQTAQMPVPLMRDMKMPVPEVGKGVYGLLLNAKCDTEKVAAWVDSLGRRLGISSLQVRPHPGFPSDRLAGIPFSVICDWHQPLDEYLDGLDLVFALNTNALIDALLHGVPVAYVSGLDPYAFDPLGWVADGIIIPYTPEEPFPAAVTAFYSSDSFKTMWNPGEFTSNGSGEYGILMQIPGGSP